MLQTTMQSIENKSFVDAEILQPPQTDPSNTLSLIVLIEHIKIYYCGHEHVL